ncbi:MAG: AI-2E family transporter [Dehalococcoidia bacterium]
MDRGDPQISLIWLTRAALIVLALVALFLLAWRLSAVVLLFFGTAVVAAILLSAASPLRRFTPLGPKASLTIAGLAIAAAIAGFLYFLGSRIAAEVTTLAQETPKMLNDLGSRFGVEDLWSQAADFVRSGWLGDVFGYVPNVLSGVTLLILVVFAGVFLASAPEMYREGVAKLVPGMHRDKARRVLNHSGRALQLWLVGKLISMVVVGAATTTGLLLLGVPNAVGLGVIAGLFEFVPFVGPLLSFIPAGLVALSQGGASIWWVLGLYVLIQQLESNLLVPLIQERTVDLPPVLGMFSIVAMGTLFGPLGMVLGVPVTIVAMVAVKELYLRETLGEEVDVPGENKGD